MARAEALANQLADGVLPLLQAIDNVADANKWFTKPATVKRQSLATFLMMDPVPALAVEVGRWDSEQLAASRHRATVQFRVHCKVQGDLDNSERDLNRLAADVAFAIAQDETLGGKALMVVEDFAYEPQTEAMMQSGLGLATVTFSVMAEYDHTTTNPT